MADGKTEGATVTFDRNTSDRGYLLFSCLLWLAAFYLFVIDASKSSLIDFEVYRVSGERWFNGQPIYSSPVDTQDHLGQHFSPHYIYPPPLAAFFGFAVVVSPETAKYIWLTILFGSVFASACFALQCLKSVPLIAARQHLSFLVIGALFICYEPIYWGIKMGQCDVLVMLLFCAGLYFIQQNRIPWAGFFVTWAGWLKIFPGLALFALFSANLPSALGGVVAALVAGTWFLSAFGSGGHTQLDGFFEMLYTSLDSAKAVALRTDFSLVRNLCALDVACGSHVIIGAVLLSLLVIFWARRIETERLYALSIVAIFFCLPTFHFQHLSWLAVPFVVLAKEALLSSDRLASGVKLLIIYFLIDQQNLLVYNTLRQREDALEFVQLGVHLLLAVLGMLLIKSHRIKKA